ncbi:hypothetical protein KG088_06595 [Halomonas sp. TRM85114]|uniref:hypothetical protein n=1 Tax=Halomonas jincaotanensis TaxID=2810616 RepID=UPI001BD5AE95|nr:hypothetical protein [Halomonas jincaotanensis]MBS9403293.1 hypothetical protein [Halomonas jincaotanensis]
MDNTNGKLSKIDTRNLLRHATARSSTKTVAAMIDVPGPRISEGKRGEWQLSIKAADKLREMFGSPLAEAGLFLECEVWETLEDLQAESDSVARWRQWQRVVAAVRHPELQLILASLVSPEQSAGGARVSEPLGSLLQDAELVSWYHNSKMTLSDAEASSRDRRSRSFPLSLSSPVLSESGLKITEILQRHGLMPHWEWHTSPLMKHSLTLILLAELACNRQQIGELSNVSEELYQPFITPWPEIDKPDQAHPIETVVTGDIIWRERAWIAPSMCSAAVLPLAGLPDVTAWLTSVDYELRWLTGILPDRFNHLDLQVAMTENLNYHLVLTLSLQRAVGSACHMEEERLFSANLDDDMFVEWISARHMVVREVKSGDLFDTIDRIHRWLGLIPPETYTLKREIARNGGYLAGVLYLE